MCLPFLTTLSALTRSWAKRAASRTSHRLANPTPTARAWSRSMRKSQPRKVSRYVKRHSCEYDLQSSAVKPGTIGYPSGRISYPSASHRALVSAFCSCLRAASIGSSASQSGHGNSSFDDGLLIGLFRADSGARSLMLNDFGVESMMLVHESRCRVDKFSVSRRDEQTLARVHASHQVRVEPRGDRPACNTSNVSTVVMSSLVSSGPYLSRPAGSS